MSGMFEPRCAQFYTGMYYEYYPTLENRLTGIKFNYEKAGDERGTFSQPIRNLVTREKKLVISTTAPMKWKVGAYVLTQDGRLWVIEDWMEDTSINPQAAYFFKRKMETATLSLTEVDNPLGLTV